MDCPTYHIVSADEPASERLLRVEEVKARVGFGRGHIHRLMAAGKFPKNRRLSHKLAVWSETEINAWVRDALDRKAAA